MDQKVFGKMIKEGRKEKSLTQQELANMLMISSYKTISKWENGICMPDISLLPKISEVLDISLYELLGGSKKELNEKGVETVLKNTIKKVDSNNKMYKILKILVIGLTVYLIIVSVLFGYRVYKNIVKNYVIAPEKVEISNFDYNSSILDNISFYNFYTFKHHGIVNEGIEDALIRKLPLYKTKIGDTGIYFKDKGIIYNFSITNQYEVSEKEINEQYQDDYYTKKAMYVISCVLFNQVAGLEYVEFVYKDTSYKIDIDHMKNYFNFIKRQDGTDANNNYVVAEYIDFDSNLENTYNWKKDVIEKLNDKKYLYDFFKTN